MEILTDIVTNRILLSCILTIIIAQLAKIGVESIKRKKLDFSKMFSTGGMPSGHSAVVAAMVTAIYLTEGVSSLFAVVLVIAIITIYDSLTIRRAVGDHTSILNTILKALKLHTKYAVRELAGHSFTQVIVGLIMGILLTLIVFWM